MKSTSSDPKTYKEYANPDSQSNREVDDYYGDNDDENSPYLKQKILQRHKSDPKFKTVKKKGNQNIKSGDYYLQQQVSGNKKQKKLISHPTVKK